MELTLTLNISGWIIVSNDAFEEPVVKCSAVDAEDYIVKKLGVEDTQLDYDLYDEALECNHNGHSFGLTHKGKTYNAHYYSKIIKNF